LDESRLTVVVSPDIEAKFQDVALMNALREVLSLDPRPSYHNDPEREYGMSFAGYNVKFRVAEEQYGQVLHVVEIS
jgi:hypothetical protein